MCHDHDRTSFSTTLFLPNPGIIIPSMGNIKIPPNEPTAPRWLLDLHEWRIQPYTEVSKEILNSEGYGVVSYTWGVTG
jgi:hypothetical protein